jgi:hypothetical protein
MSLASLVICLSPSAAADPLTTAFTYQGRLTNSGSAASGLYDFEFLLFDGANQLGVNCYDNVQVTGGLFTVVLDFGAQFNGQQRELEIRVRLNTGLNCSNVTGFTTLSPRQDLTVVPHASFSVSAGNAGLLDGFDSSAFARLGQAANFLNVDMLVGAGQQLQFRLDDGLIPGIKVNNTGGIAGILRLRNAMEVWPSDDATRAGRIDVRNTSGTATIGLDGQSGAISSNNFPRVKFVQTYRDVRNNQVGVPIQPGQSPNIDTISVNIPSAGVLILRATIQLHDFFYSSDPVHIQYFKLSDTTSGAATLCETAWGGDVSGFSPTTDERWGNLTLEWAVNVSAGTRSYSTSLYNSGGALDVYYFTTTLSAVFMPAGL